MRKGAVLPDREKDATRAATAHDVTERERLIRARTYASLVRSQPELINEARRRIRALLIAGDATTGQRLWAHVLDEPLEFVVSAMLSESAEGRLLRSNNPFSTIIGADDIPERRRTWRQAKSELSRIRT